MIGLLPILTRWRFGLSIAAVVAAFGLIIASWHYRSAYHAERTLRRADRAAYASAQTEAARIAYDALKAAEARSQIKAQEADHAHETELADARGALARYIAANRVRGQTVAGDASTAIAASADRGASVSASVPGDSILVSESDLQACDGAVTYAIGAHNWALSLKISP